MKIDNKAVHKWQRISVNGRRDRQGNPVPGVVISQHRAFIVASPEEWEKIKRAGDEAIAAQKPEQRMA